jgi:hypothetical protein
VRRLIAPSGAAHSGVTLDGEQLGRANRWHGQPATETIAPADGGYELTVPGLQRRSRHCEPASGRAPVSAPNWVRAAAT